MLIRSALAIAVIAGLFAGFAAEAAPIPAAPGVGITVEFDGAMRGTPPRAPDH